MQHVCQRMADVTDRNVRLMVDIAFKRKQRKHAVHRLLNLVDTLAAPGPDRRTDIMNRGDARLFERQLQIEIEVGRVDAYKHRGWLRQKMLLQAPSDGYDLTVVFQHLDIAANRQFFHRIQRGDACGNHARAGNAGKLQIGPARFECFNQMRAEYQKLNPIPNPFRLSDADPRNEYRDALKHLVTTSKSVGAQLILTGEPCLCRELMTPENAALLCTFLPKSPSQPTMMVKVQSGWVEREIRRYQEVAQDLAKENQLTFVDLNETLLPDADHFVNEMILTDQGAREMAAQLLPKVWPVVQKIRAL